MSETTLVDRFRGLLDYGHQLTQARTPQLWDLLHEAVCKIIQPQEIVILTSDGQILAGRPLSAKVRGSQDFLVLEARVQIGSSDPEGSFGEEERRLMACLTAAAETALQTERASTRMQAAFSGCPFATALTTEDGSLIQANQAMLDMLGPHSLSHFLPSFPRLLKGFFRSQRRAWTRVLLWRETGFPDRLIALSISRIAESATGVITLQAQPSQQLTSLQSFQLFRRRNFQEEIRAQVIDKLLHLPAVHRDGPLASSILDSARRLCREESLVPDSGVRGLLEELAQEYTTRFALEFQIRGGFGHWKGAPAQATLRIVQESLRNIEKHSSARAVSLRLKANSREIRGTIWDDGIGFRMRGSGFGLNAMRLRARLLGGQLKFRSGPEVGTRISFFIPHV